MPRKLDLDTEKHLVHCVLEDEEKRPEIFLKLKSEHFQDVICRKLYSAALELHLAGKPVDIFSAARAGKVDDYHEFLELHIPLGIDTAAALKTLQDRHARQCLQDTLKACAVSLNNDQVDFDELRATVSQKLFKALQDGAQADEQHPADITLAMYEERKAAGGRLSGVPSGFSELDNAIGGLQPGALTVIGGRSSHGKTTLAQDFCFYAGTHDLPCLYISLEAPSSETFLFLLQKCTGLAPLAIKRGCLSPDEEGDLRAAVEYLKACPFYFYDQSSRLADIMLIARSMAHASKIKMLIVDYIQLVENQLKGEGRHLQVAGVSRALKRLAMDAGIAVVVLSQLNKEPDARGGRIHLSDVRESEAITHDADHVLFINRPSLYGDDGSDYLELAKNRHGQRIDKIPVNWNQKKNTYINFGSILL